MIEIKDIYLKNENFEKICGPFNFVIKEQSINIIRGLNGSGKSFLSSCFLGLDDKKYLNSRDSAIIPPFPPTYYLMQNAILQFTATTVEEEFLAQDPNYNGSEIAGFLAMMNCGSLLGKNILQLSSGERQKIGLCLAAASDEKVIILDQPDSNLDESSIPAMHILLQHILEQNKTLIILTTSLDNFNFETENFNLIDLSGHFNRNDLEPRLKELPIPPALLKLSDNYECALAFKNLTIKRESQLLIESCEGNLNHGDFCKLSGGNGTGKSTLILYLAGLLNDKNSKLTYFDEFTSGKQLVSVFFQESYSQLSGLMLSEDAKLELGENFTYFQKLFSMLDMEKLLHTSPFRLSFGEIKFYTLLKILFSGADFFLLDEPFVALDDMLKWVVFKLMLALNQRGKTFLIISHEKQFENYFSREFEIRDKKLLSHNRKKQETL